MCIYVCGLCGLSPSCLQRLFEKMYQAAMGDFEDFKKGRPALRKLTMLEVGG